VADDESVLTRAARPPDVVVSYGDHRDQIADVRFADEGARNRPLVLIIHGGFWRPRYDRKHTSPMAEGIAAAGWTVATVEYRRVPGQPDSTLNDVSTALQTLPAKIARHNGKVVTIGHSAGGHLVLWAAAARGTAQLCGTLALAPVADLQMAHHLNLGSGAVTTFLGTEPGKRVDVDPAQLASPASATTIVHGEDDQTVPVSLSESYVAGHGVVRFVRLAGVEHFAPIDPLSDSWPTILREVHRLTDQD
jgi:acetyl esterase/lipase